MKLIIERTLANVYVYRESEKHHREIELIRIKEGMLRVDHKMLDDECLLDVALQPGEYMVFNLKGW